MFQCVVSQVADTMRSTELRTVSAGSVEVKSTLSIKRGHVQEPPACLVFSSPRSVGRAGVQWGGRRLEAVKGWGWEGPWMDGVQRAFSWRSTPENHEYRGGITAGTRPLFQV